MKKLGLVLVFISLLQIPVLSLFAGDGTTGDYFSEMGTKFGRGIWNVVSSPADIPCTMSDDMKAGNPAGGFFSGLGKGIVYMGRRILVGVTEVGTFMIPAERTIPAACSDSSAA